MILLEKKRKGLRRHEALHALSHHHTNMLHMALKLKRADTDKSTLTAKETLQELKAIWHPDGQQHFREEEEILLTAFAQYASIDQPEISEMLIEHVKIRAYIDTLLTSEEADIPRMHELGELLEMHIRKEERTIFPMIEQALPEQKLQDLAPYLH